MSLDRCAALALFSGNIEIPMSTTPKPPVTGANGGLTPDAGCLPHSLYTAMRRHQVRLNE